MFIDPVFIPTKDGLNSRIPAHATHADAPFGSARFRDVQRSSAQLLCVADRHIGHAISRVT